MKHSLPLKNSLVAGTLLLTLAGSLSRVIGFFYRIFLSRTIGAEGIGIYQLIFPLLALCISLTSSGIQTAVSKFTAEKYGSGRTGEAFLCLYAGFFLSIASSLSACTFLCRYADALAAGYLDEPRCAPLIRIMAYSLPFSAVHACANGYYYGMKKAAGRFPAVRTGRAGSVRLCHRSDLYRKGCRALCRYRSLGHCLRGDLFRSFLHHSPAFPKETGAFYRNAKKHCAFFASAHRKPRRPKFFPEPRSTHDPVQAASFWLHTV